MTSWFRWTQVRAALAFALFLGGVALGQPPADYYQTVTTQTGEALKHELYMITSGQRGYPINVLSYNGARVALQESVDNVGGGQVRMFYTNELRSDTEWPGDQSREHIWPQSRGADVSPAVSDMHHLTLCHNSVNNSRGNMLFGNVTGGTAVSNPTGQPADQNYYSGGVWQVSPRHRGDAARAILYMDMRYPHLSLVSRGETVGDNQMAYLDDLLLWHDQDPPDAFEIERNNRIFTYQNNRNPFVDNPQWVERVYGDGSISVEDGDTVTVSFTDRAPGIAPWGATIPLMSIHLETAGSEWDAGLLVFDNLGTIADDALTLSVYTDLGNTGTIGQLDPLLGSNSFVSGETSIVLGPPPRTTPEYPVNLLVVGQVAGSAAPDASVQVRLRANSIFHSSTGGNDIDPTHAAFDSGIAMVPDSEGGVFISEYVEGSSFNKALEIYNGTAHVLDLTEWKVEVYFNGNTTPTPAAGIPLVGSVYPGGVHVIAHQDAAAAVLNRADQTVNNLSYNGDDALVLRGPENVIADTFGRVGEQAVWGTAPTISADATLRRKSTIRQGDTDPFDAFDPAVEWDGFPNNTFDGLGAHVVDTGNELPVVGVIDASIAKNSPGFVTIPFTDADDPPATMFLIFTENASSGAFDSGVVERTGANEYEARFFYTPADDFFGTVTFDFILSDLDGPDLVMEPMNFEVAEVNEPPSISGIPDQLIAMNGTSGPIPFTISDPETPAAQLTLVAETDDPDLVPLSGIVFGGSGENRTVTVTPAPDMFGGPVEIVVRVEDPEGGFAESIFEVEVTEASAVSESVWILF